VPRARRDAPVDLVRYAKDLELDIEPFRDALRRHAYAKRIAEDIATAQAGGATGTPTFFINGKRHDGGSDIDTLVSGVHDARASFDAAPFREAR
jgi:protein-disulfide isomerase